MNAHPGRVKTAARPTILPAGLTSSTCARRRPGTAAPRSLWVHPALELMHAPRKPVATTERQAGILASAATGW
jgi:hypothetical protein